MSKVRQRRFPSEIWRFRRRIPLPPFLGTGHSAHHPIMSLIWDETCGAMGTRETLLISPGCMGGESDVLRVQMKVGWGRPVRSRPCPPAL